MIGRDLGARPGSPGSTTSPRTWAGRWGTTIRGSSYAGTDAGRLKTTVPAPEDRGRHRRTRIPRLPYSFPDDTSSLPAANKPAHRRFSAQEKKALRIIYQRRIEAARGLDRGVAELFATLQETGQLERTLVVFTSDNGAHRRRLQPQRQALPLGRLDPDPRADARSRPARRHARSDGAYQSRHRRHDPRRGRRHAAPVRWTASTSGPGYGPRPGAGGPDAGWPGDDGRRRFYCRGAGGRLNVRPGSAAGRGAVRPGSRSRDMQPRATTADSQAVLGALRRLTQRYRDCAAESCPREFYPRRPPPTRAGSRYRGEHVRRFLLARLPARPTLARARLPARVGRRPGAGARRTHRGVRRRPARRRRPGVADGRARVGAGRCARCVILLADLVPDGDPCRSGADGRAGRPRARPSPASGGGWPVRWPSSSVRGHCACCCGGWREAGSSGRSGCWSTPASRPSHLLTAGSRIAARSDELMARSGGSRRGGPTAGGVRITPPTSGGRRARLRCPPRYGCNCGLRTPRPDSTAP